jgi:hypothetical protein
MEPGFAGVAEGWCGGRGAFLVLVAARSDREHTGTHALGELHGEVADAAAGTEDHNRLAGLEGQRVIQAAKRGHRVNVHRARLLGRQLVGDARDVVSLERGVTRRRNRPWDSGSRKRRRGRLA